MKDLTKQQIDAIEEMIARRMSNTGESRAEACAHIYNYLTNGTNQRATT